MRKRGFGRNIIIATLRVTLEKDYFMVRQHLTAVNGENHGRIPTTRRTFAALYPSPSDETTDVDSSTASGVRFTEMGCGAVKVSSPPAAVSETTTHAKGVDEANASDRENESRRSSNRSMDLHEQGGLDKQEMKKRTTGSKLVVQFLKNKFKIAQSLFQRRSEYDPRVIEALSDAELAYRSGNKKPMGTLQKRIHQAEKNAQRDTLEGLWAFYDDNNDHKITYAEFECLLRDWFDAQYYHMPTLITRNWVQTMKLLINKLKSQGKPVSATLQFLEKKEDIVSQRLPMHIHKLFQKYDNTYCFRKIFERADRNGDGVLSKKEFMRSFFEQFESTLHTSSMMDIIRHQLHLVTSI
eukprot:jgi/Bigna1/81989/fgenesh1_pg.86_\